MRLNIICVISEKLFKLLSSAWTTEQRTSVKKFTCKVEYTKAFILSYNV